MLVFSIRGRVREGRRGSGGWPEIAFGGGEREVDDGEKVEERETEDFGLETSCRLLHENNLSKDIPFLYLYFP